MDYEEQKVNGLMKYPIAESTGVATDNIDDIIGENSLQFLQEQYNTHGTVGPNPAYDEDGNIIPSTGYPPDIALAPIGSMKGLLGVVKGLFKRKTVDLYRGTPNWYRGKMVKDGKYVGGGEAVAETQRPIYSGLAPESLFTTTKPGIAKMFSFRANRDSPGYILKFKVPEKYIKKHAIGSDKTHLINRNTKVFEKGLPKRFLEEVEKMNYLK
tara:strand:+ start:2794 stop:3429 length:636 start_codon:yes stop_codon:yes gene_type:complete